jgi:tetratricopeptide (TPR) repeat protein
MMEIARRAVITAFLGISLICANPPASSAERIYYKDGRLADGDILYRSKGTIWIAEPGGAVGVPAYTISRIEDSNGDISIYDYESIISLIRRLIENKVYSRAVALCDRLVGLFPEYAPGRILRAGLNQKLNNIVAASKDYDYLIERNQADAAVYNDRGAISAAENNLSRAKECFLEAVNRAPEMAAANQNLAEVYMRLKDFEMAIARYEKLLELEPSNSNAMFNLGVAYQYAGESAKARSAWEKVLSIDPNYADAQAAIQGLSSLTK